MTAIHLATPREFRNRVYSRCGHWTSTFTTDPAQVTCKSCLRLHKLDSKATPMKTTISSILLVLSLFTGCGDTSTDMPTSGDSTSSSSSSSSSGEAPTSGEASPSTGGDSDSSSSGGMSSAPMDKAPPTAGTSESTTGDDSTSDSDSSSGDSSTGDASTGDSTGGVIAACWAEECNEDRPCANNLACLPHPITGLMNCAASDCAAPGPCDKSELACGSHVPLGECFKDVTGHSWCHPRQCKEDLTCEVGTCSPASGACH